MPQNSHAVPPDLSNNGWTVTPPQTQVAACINISGALCPAPGPNQIATSSATPKGDAFLVRLSGMSWPQSGPQVLTLNLAGDGGTPVYVTLFQGTLMVASRLFTPGASFGAFAMTLTLAETALITNYSQLSLQVIAGIKAPVIEWKLNETSGTIAHDSSSNLDHLSFVGSPSWDSATPGPQAGSGGSLLFPSTSDSCHGTTVGGVPIGNSREIDQTQRAKKTTDLQGGCCVQFVSSGDSLRIFIPSAQNSGALVQTNSTLTTTANIDLNWHHICVAFDTAGNRYYYLDGALQGNAAASPLNTGTIGSLDLSGFGSGTPHLPFLGYLKDVRVYDFTLNAAQAKAIYDGTF